MLRRNRFFGCCVVGLVLAGSASAGTIYVDKDATGNDDGTSWTDAYTSVSTALASASSGDEVWVAEGSYSNITLVDGVKMYGGFDGTETSKSQGNPSTYMTAISGGGTTRAVVGTNLGTSTLVQGFHIINGVNPSMYEGAGVLLTDSSPMFVNCVIRDNDFSYMGGGVANLGDGDPTFINCKFYHNDGIDDPDPEKPDIEGFAGGAFFNRQGSPTFVNCVFYENTAMEGGAIASMSGEVTLINCTLADNTASYKHGGALNDHSGGAVVKNCIFWGNEATNEDSDQIYNSSGTTTVTYSDIEGGWTGTGNINSNPKFVNPTSDNYKIGGPFGNPSPCKDTGNDSDVPGDTGDLDWDSNTSEDTPLDLSLDMNRFSFNGVDMGAYEWAFSEQ